MAYMAAIWSIKSPAANIFARGTQSIAIQGAIEPGDYEKFLAEIDKIRKRGDTVTQVVTYDSPGGKTLPALKIGLWMHENSVDSLAVGKCISACANYIFLAGRIKRLQNAAIGFHGSPSTTEHFYPGTSERFYREVLANDFQERGYSSLENAFRDFHWMEIEGPKFYREIGVDESFFFVSGHSKNLKLMGCGPNSGIWFPTIEQMQQYGVANISGTLDTSLTKEECYAPDFSRSQSMDWQMQRTESESSRFGLEDRRKRVFEIPQPTLNLRDVIDFHLPPKNPPAEDLR